MKVKDEPRLIQVRWLDSMAWDRWEQRKTMRERLVESDGGLEHLTVGWLIDDSEQHIIVAGSRHSTDDVWNDAMAIPRVAVLSIVDLGEVKAK